MTKVTREGTIWGTFLGGWGITVAGFLAPPLGVIDSSVLMVLGQSLLYCGGAIGLKSYITNAIQKNINSLKEKEKTNGK